MEEQSERSTFALRQLSDSELTISQPSQDVRGRKVVDCDGQELGKVDALYVDEQERKIRFLRVKSGGFLGIAAEKLLIPVDSVVRVETDVVCVSENAARVAGAPGYEPELMDQREYYAKLYEYYGYNPYWTAGYTYPMFPFAPPPPPAPLRGKPS